MSALTRLAKDFTSRKQLLKPEPLSFHDQTETSYASGVQVSIQLGRRNRRASVEIDAFFFEDVRAVPDLGINRANIFADNPDEEQLHR
jgi:hypothetical protein